MKKIMNSPSDFVKETIEGILLAYPDKLKISEENNRVILSKYPHKKGKVGIVTGGGSGHLPVFLGYVGDGMADGCAIGNVFTSPSYQAILTAIRACDFGAGVLCLYGNYGGDKMNFNQACEDAEADNIRVKSVRVSDDIASDPKGEEARRRGVAGLLFAYKMAGAAANRMMPLEEVSRVASKAVENTRTMGIALSSCVIPEVGKPTFFIADDEIEFGMGIHGEKGLEVRKMMTADKITEIIMGKILEDMPLNRNDEVSLMINGLGATPLEEQFIIYRKAAQMLKEIGVHVLMPHIGEYATSMEMAGISITICRLDDELEGLLYDPADTPFYTNHNK